MTNIEYTDDRSLDTDNTLGGDSPSDYKKPSQKAIKNYVDTKVGEIIENNNLSKIQYSATVLESGSITLSDSFSFYSIEPTSTTAFTFSVSGLTINDGKYLEFILRINMIELQTLTFPNNITWDNDTAPSISAVGLYYLSFRSENKGKTWQGKLEWKSQYPVVQTYKAALLLDNTYIDVADLGITDNINPDTTTGAKQGGYYDGRCNYFIINSKLYYYDNSTLTQCGNLTGWTDVISYYKSSSSTNYGFGICNGVLYKLTSSSSQTQCGDLTGWTFLSGDNPAGYLYGYVGICGGALYHISTDGGTITQVGSSTDWTYLAVCHTNGGFGICGGALYYISITQNQQPVLTQYGNGTDWVSVCGCINSSRAYGYALNSNGNLFILQASNTITKLGADTWDKIKGMYYQYSSTRSRALGLKNGTIYQLTSSTPSESNIISEFNDWDDIYCSSGGGYNKNCFLCLRNGNLYVIDSYNKTVTSTSFTNVVKVSGAAGFPSSSAPSLIVYKDE